MFSSRELEEIKQSTVNVIGKQVLQWTPVVIGTEFPRLVNKMKVDYIGGDFLNKQDFPKKLESIQGGVILNLPLVGIKDTLTQMIDLGNMMSDGELLAYLESMLDQ